MCVYIYCTYVIYSLHITFYTSYIVIHAYIFIDVEYVIYIYACVCIGSNLHGDITTKYTVKWFLTWNDDDKNDLVGGLEHVLFFHSVENFIIPTLTHSIIFQRG